MSKKLTNDSTTMAIRKLPDSTIQAGCLCSPTLKIPE